MKKEDTADLESEFNLTIPKDYIAVASGAVANDLDCYTLEVSLSELIEANRLFRKECPYEFSWQHSFWWIGHDGGGGFYFIDTLEHPCKVYHYDCESPSLESTHRSDWHSIDIETHLSEAIEIEDYSKAYDERMRERILNRKWWEFWIPRSWPTKLRG